MSEYLYGKRFGSSQTFSQLNTPTFSNLVVLQTYPPMKMEHTECSETSAYKIQMPGNYPEESIQHTEHGEILKSGTCQIALCELSDFCLDSSHLLSLVMTFCIISLYTYCEEESYVSAISN